ncbi:TadG family pilus assembly protein [Nitratireductor sp. StC3]|uniref:TadG family pilus assembly protein n=1 Tax=Nitratireductor sp. StC3 TaxID=2126741 RepID=UPI000D0DA0E0|nr:TadG family pilus assembly protein [Nitratireductor sp. StC3]PSM18275.1 hypothetical protein C7T96_10425 [Nitratireductor sp. StC3]
MTSSRPKRLRRAAGFLTDRKGNLATMSAFLAPLALAMAAFAIDAGALYNEKREVQTLADIAAIAGARRLDAAEDAVIAALRDNRLGSITVIRDGEHPDIPAAGENLLTVETGLYTPDPDLPVSVRFERDHANPNAVRVTLTRTGKRFFAETLMGSPTIAVTSTASATPKAAFSIGSRLASLNGGLVNDLLGGLLGTNLSLSAMDYDALLDADVSLFGFLDALASEIDLDAGTYSQLLATEATIGDIAKAVAATDGANPALRTALHTIATSPNAATIEVPLSHMIDLGEAASLALGSGRGAFDASLGVMELITGSAVAANGQNQVALDLGAAIPGLARVTAAVAIGEPMQQSGWFALGEHGTVVRTAQTRARIDVQIGGTGILRGVAIKLPLFLEVAYAEGRLKRIACPDGTASSAQVTVATRPGIAELRIAETSSAGFADFTRTLSFQDADIVSVPLIKVRGQARVNIGNGRSTDLRFNATDIRNATVKTASTRDITSSLTASLLGELDLEVRVLGLGLGLGAVTNTLAGILGAVTPAIDNLLADLLGVLGVRLGEADVKVSGVRCARSVLVQ